MSSFLWLAVGAQLFSLVVGLVSYKKEAVSGTGLFALLLISASFIWMNQIGLLFLLFLMFASSSLLTKFKQSEKKEVTAVSAKTGPRDYKQALANLGVACLCMVLYYVTEKNAFIAAFAGSVAAANADSWASEIGSLSKSRPVMITTFRPVQKGISGGVTLLGLLGGAAGSLFISVSAVPLLMSSFHDNALLLCSCGFFAGFAGCVLDSYMGAWVQALYKNKNTDEITENASLAGVFLTKGSKWVDNDMVNLLTTIAGAGMGGGMYVLLG